MFDAGEHLTNRQVIVDLAAKHRLPAIYPYREFVEVGGLVSYGVDVAEVLRRLADVTADVLGGAKPGDIRFYQQTKFELVLNRTNNRTITWAGVPVEHARRRRRGDRIASFFAAHMSADGPSEKCRHVPLRSVQWGIADWICSS